MQRVPPTSVVVTVNPSQVELLKVEAGHLRAKVADLPNHLKPDDTAGNRLYLLNALQESIDALDHTKKKYVELEKNPLFLPKVNVFFDNIGTSYKVASMELDKKVAQQTKPRLVEANQVGTFVDLAVALVKASIIHNADAYELVADAEELTFDFKVSSTPMPGATIAYKLWGDGDEDYVEVNGETPVTIPNLPRAVYYVRIRLENYVEKKGVRFDATKEKTGEMIIKLDPVKRP